MIVLSRVYAIFHAAICFPIGYLAGACHKLDTQDFSCSSMGQVIDILDGKLNEIVEMPSLFIDHDFMLGMFNESLERIPDFKEYLTYMFEEKVSPTIDKKEKEIITLDKLVAEVFYPERDENKQPMN